MYGLGQAHDILVTGGGMARGILRSPNPCSSPTPRLVTFIQSRRSDCTQLPTLCTSNHTERSNHQRSNMHESVIFGTVFIQNPIDPGSHPLLCSGSVCHFDSM